MNKTWKVNKEGTNSFWLFVWQSGILTFNNIQEAIGHNRDIGGGELLVFESLMLTALEHGAVALCYGAIWVYIASLLAG